MTVWQYDYDYDGMLVLILISNLTVYKIKISESGTTLQWIYIPVWSRKQSRNAFDQHANTDGPAISKASNFRGLVPSIERTGHCGLDPRSREDQCVPDAAPASKTCDLWLTWTAACWPNNANLSIMPLQVVQHWCKKHTAQLNCHRGLQMTNDSNSNSNDSNLRQSTPTDGDKVNLAPLLEVCGSIHCHTSPKALKQWEPWSNKLTQHHHPISRKCSIRIPTKKQHHWITETNSKCNVM